MDAESGREVTYAGLRAQVNAMTTGLAVELPPALYREVRRRATLEDREPGVVVTAMCREES